MAKTDWNDDQLLILELGQFFTVKDETRKMVFEADGKIPAKTYILHKAAQINDFDFNEIYERELKKLELEENPENSEYWRNTIIEEIQYKIDRHISLTTDMKYRNRGLVLKAESFIQFLNDMDKKTETINRDEVYKFENKFDRVNNNKVYNFFKTELVEKKYLSLENLHAYLKIAFENQQPPQTKFNIEPKYLIKNIRVIFYKYYSEINQEKYNTQDKYIRLLTDYFEGFEFEKVKKNFNK